MASVPGQRRAGKHKNLPAKSDAVLVPACIADSNFKLQNWTLLVEDLKARGLWSPTYTIGLQEFVEVINRLNEIKEIIDEDGLMIDKFTATGLPCGQTDHPLIKQELAYRRQLNTYLQRFGMTPQDIVFLTQTDPTSEQIIEATATDSKIVYFR